MTVLFSLLQVRFAIRLSLFKQSIFAVSSKYVTNTRIQDSLLNDRLHKLIRYLYPEVTLNILSSRPSITSANIHPLDVSEAHVLNACWLTVKSIIHQITRRNLGCCDCCEPCTNS